MAFYEYVCQDCGVSFEMRRSMAEADCDLSCPDGHRHVRRKLSVFASMGSSSNAVPGTGSAGGGCCGGACGCAR